MYATVNPKLLEMFNVLHGTELGLELGPGDSSIWKAFVSEPKIARFWKMGRTKLRPIHPKNLTPNLFFFIKIIKTGIKKFSLKIKLNSNEAVIICTMEIKERETLE